MTAGPEQIVDLVFAVLEAGASGVMFSEIVRRRDRQDGPRGDQSIEEPAGDLRP